MDVPRYPRVQMIGRCLQKRPRCNTHPLFFTDRSVEGQNGSGCVVGSHVGGSLGWANKVNNGLDRPAYRNLHVILFGEVAKKDGPGFLR